MRKGLATTCYPQFNLWRGKSFAWSQKKVVLSGKEKLCNNTKNDKMLEDKIWWMRCSTTSCCWGRLLGARDGLETVVCLSCGSSTGLLKSDHTIPHHQYNPCITCIIEITNIWPTWLKGKHTVLQCRIIMQRNQARIILQPLWILVVQTTDWTSKIYFLKCTYI